MEVYRKHRKLHDEKTGFHWTGRTFMKILVMALVLMGANAALPVYAEDDDAEGTSLNSLLNESLPPVQEALPLDDAPAAMDTIIPMRDIPIPPPAFNEAYIPSTPGVQSGLRILPVASEGYERQTHSMAEIMEIQHPREIGERLTINVGRSLLIRSQWVISRIAVGNSAIADVQVLTPDQFLLVGNSPGKTDLILWSENGAVWQTQVNVEVDVKDLNTRLSYLFPTASLEITRVEGIYFITGQLDHADQAVFLKRFMDASEVDYVDMTTLPGLQQVQIQVRVAEVNRVAVRRLGLNAFGVGNDYFAASLIGSESGGALNPVTIGVPQDAPAVPGLPFAFIDGVTVNPLITLMAGFPGKDLQFFLQALAENQYLHLLAEPNLVALSGEEATFLAGGEFPIPVVQASAGGGTSISIQYKEFGVRLRFLPTVLGNGNIRLEVAPEVSDLSTLGAVEIQGFQIPSVLTRRSETTLEMKSGQTFAMAGLLNRNVNTRNTRVPLLGDLPILGSMFRSVSYQTGESELVILVTANLVEPMSDIDGYLLPGETDTTPNDWELFLLGRIQGMRAPHPNLAERHDLHSFHQLRGPGGWDNYD